MSEKVDAGARCEACDVVGEGCGREIDEVRALRQADGPPGAPMHRNSVFRLDAVDRIRSLLGVKVTLNMARNNGRSPASDWHQGYIDLRYFIRLKLRTGVARIPPSAGALNEEAERRSAMRAPEMSATVVVGSQDTYPQPANFDQIPRRDLPKASPAGGDWLEQAA